MRVLGLGVLPYLEENVRDLPRVCFQQDGGTAYTANVSMNVNRKAFAGRVIFRNGDIPCSSVSSALSPYDFSMCRGVSEDQSVSW